MGETFEYCKYLSCWWPKHAFVNLVNAECVDEEKKRIDEIMDIWSKTRDKFSELIKTEKGMGRSIQSTDIPDEYSEKVKIIANDPAFLSTFNQLPVEFKMVEIDKLAALQNFVHMDYVKKIIDRFPKKFDMDALIDICLDVRGVPADVSEFTNGNITTFSSESEDLRFLGAIPRTALRPDLINQSLGGVPSKILLLAVGYGSSPINVLSFGGRMILNNGFHRVYALRQAGVTHIPVVVQKIVNPALDWPISYSPTLKQYIMSAEKMPLLKEYFNDELTIILKTKAKRKAVKIKWEVEEFTVPI